jgi:hypothetical protein
MPLRKNDVVVILRKDCFGELGIVDRRIGDCYWVNSIDGLLLLSPIYLEVIDHIEEEKPQELNITALHSEKLPWPYNAPGKWSLQGEAHLGAMWMKNMIVKVIVSAQEEKVTVKCWGCGHVLGETKIDFNTEHLSQ